MSQSYYPQDVTTPNLGLSLYDISVVEAQNFIILDSTIATIVAAETVVSINGAVFQTPNFVNSASVTFTTVGNNVSATASGGGTGAWATLTGDLTETQAIPWDGPIVGTPDTGISR